MSNVYWWTPTVEPEFLSDSQIREEARILRSEGRVDAVDECEVALGLDGCCPNGLTDYRTGIWFGVFEARRRVCRHINARGARP